MLKRFLFFFILLSINCIGAELLQKEGQFVLHLHGTPYERGHQHGTLLKEKIQDNLKSYLDNPDVMADDRVDEYRKNIHKVITYIPKHFQEEMKGISDGAEVAFEKILMLNLFPEMFHCIGITVNDEATVDHSLYHVRVLDYGVGKDLQNSAVLMVVKPEGKHAYLNVSYAGFVGSITGMNEQKVAIGEIGGDGYGHWDGMPMAFLLREILENARTLDDAKDILSSSPRTCEYYYVISDGKTEEAIGVYATASQLHFIEPGTEYALMAPENLPKNYGDNGVNDKFFLSHYQHVSSESQNRVHNKDGELIAIYNVQPKNCIVLRGFGYPERYPVACDRIHERYGQIDAKHLQEIIKAPATNETNLHNAIFHPSTLDVWISHAGEDGNPAAEQPYVHYNLRDLL